MAHLVEYHPAMQEVTGSIPGQGTCLGCGFCPGSGQVPKATDRCFSPFLPLFLPPFPSLLKKKKDKVFKKKKTLNTGQVFPMEKKFMYMCEIVMYKCNYKQDFEDLLQNNLKGYKILCLY